MITFCTLRFFIFLQCSTVFYSVLQCSTVFYSVLQSSTEFYRVLQSSTEFYRVLQCSVLVLVFKIYTECSRLIVTPGNWIIWVEIRCGCVISQLLDEHGTVRKDYARRERLGTSGHYAYEITATLKTGRPRRACHVCANTQLRKQTRKMTHFICKKCHGVPLCIGKCFEDFHTLEVY